MRVNKDKFYTVNFDTLNSGDSFKYNEGYYMKTSPATGWDREDSECSRLNGIDIETGITYHFAPSYQVIPVTFKPLEIVK